MPMPNDGSHSTFSSNAISVPGNRQTATCGSPTAAKPRVMEFLNLVVTSLSSIWAGRVGQKEHGVGINIISGDNEVVTRKICKAIENAMLGKDVEALSDASSEVASRGQRA
jgi:hypothetical protein